MEHLRLKWLSSVNSMFHGFAISVSKFRAQELSLTSVGKPVESVRLLSE